MKKMGVVLRFLILLMIVGALVIPATAPAFAERPAAPSLNVQPSDPDPNSGGSTDPVAHAICQVVLGTSTCQVVETINNSITNLIKFPFQTLRDAIVGSINDISKEGLNQLDTALNEALTGALAWLYQNSVSESVRYTGWKAMMAIAAFLIPLTLILTVISAMKDGVNSVTGYAAARMALTEWIFAVAFTAGSYYLISLFIKISSAASYEIMRQVVSQQQIDLGAYLIGSFKMMASAIDPNNVFATLFIALFAVFMVIAVVASVVLALLAREVVLLLLTIIAPVIIILGCVNEFKWLLGLWSKALVICLLLGPINVLLLCVSAFLYEGSVEANSSMGTLPASILGMLISIGTVSVLVSLNMAIGQMVYGAAIEMAQKAFDTVVGVAKIALTAAGFVAGAGLAGGAAMSAGATGASGTASASAGGEAAAGLAGAGGGGGGGGGGSLPSAGGLSGLGGGGTKAEQALGLQRAQNEANSFGRTAQRASQMQNVGRSLANSNLPFLKSFGQGMQMGAGNVQNSALAQQGQSLAKVDAMKEGFLADKVQQEHTIQDNLTRGGADRDLSSGLAAAASNPYKGTPGNDIPTATGMVRSAVQASETLGVGPGAYLQHRVGYNPQTDNFDHAVMTAAQDNMRLLKDGNVYDQAMQHPAYMPQSGGPTGWDRGPEMVTPADINFAQAHFMSGFGADLATNADAISASAAVVSQMRHVGGLDYKAIHDSFAPFNQSGATSSDLLSQWATQNGTAYGMTGLQSGSSLADVVNTYKTQFGI